ncbi:MAG TPA: HD domain-containing phosphohydrolase [Thermoanaerobaculia bacterium]|nr:HD domain-containing phosphohydrolase [Thermoanaerobaculia bacterium]
MSSRLEGLSSFPDPGAARVFVVDDDGEIRKLLKTLLVAAGYDVVEFALAATALEAIRAEAPDLLLLDIDLPDRSGHEVLEEVRADPATRLLPVVMLTGQATRESKMRAIRQGVTDFLAKPFSPEELVPRVRSLVMLKQFADEHEHTERVILTLARTIDARDPYTAGHSGRVAEYADRIAARMGLDSVARLEMRRGALFHDLGKIVVPDLILRKPGALTADERAVIEQHPVVGQELLAPMRTMRKTLPIVFSHHEKLDGSGYPDGISGSAIPAAVRIVTVSDVFDALTTDRAYRGALTTGTAFEILDEGVTKGWWDGDVVDELRGAISEADIGGANDGPR